MSCFLCVLQCWMSEIMRSAMWYWSKMKAMLNESSNPKVCLTLIWSSHLPLPRLMPTNHTRPVTLLTYPWLIPVWTTLADFRTPEASLNQQEEVCVVYTSQSELLKGPELKIHQEPVQGLLPALTFWKVSPEERSSWTLTFLSTNTTS